MLQTGSQQLQKMPGAYPGQQMMMPQLPSGPPTGHMAPPSSGPITPSGGHISSRHPMPPGPPTFSQQPQQYGGYQQPPAQHPTVPNGMPSSSGPPQQFGAQPYPTGQPPTMGGGQMPGMGGQPQVPRTGGQPPQMPSMGGPPQMPGVGPGYPGGEPIAPNAAQQYGGYQQQPGQHPTVPNGMPSSGGPPQFVSKPYPTTGQPPPMGGQPPIPRMGGQPHMPGMGGQPQMPGMGPGYPGGGPMAPNAAQQYGGYPQQPGQHPTVPNGMPSAGGPPQQFGAQPYPTGQPPSMGGQMPGMGGQPQMPGMAGQPQMMPSMGGQPQMPGMGPGYPGGGPMAPNAAQQQKRLDPNMMPSAVQVMDDDRKARTGVFPTGYPRAELPPLVTSDFFCEDQGNCFPKFLRSTLYNGPVNNDLLKQCAIPWSLCISPIAKLSAQERPLPIVNLGDLGPVRCTRCKAYMCPFMEFRDGGRRFRCPFCKSNTEVPTEYFAHLDQNGQRTDVFERPELCLGSYEFVATKEYCKNNLFPKTPAFIFMLDVSYNAMKNGIVKLFCDNIKTVLQNLPKDVGLDKSGIDIGFATYDQSVHFYNLKSALGQPKMLIVNDVQDTFVPLVDGFLVSLQEAESVVDTLLAQIPQMFADTKVTEIVLGPAIQAGMDALKSADRPGKLFMFHSSLPTFDAPGKLKNRDDRTLLGTEKEKTVLLPQSEFYNKLAQECVGAGCCVDVFLFPNSYSDVATIGCLCGVTGGQLYKYQYFQAEIDGDRFLADLKHDVERPIVFDSIMRVRTSTGIRPTDFFGNFYMSNTTDVELAALDCDKTITVEIKHDDKIEDGAVFFQVALLFTSVGGQRRLRIHNLSLNVGTDLAALYRSADLFTIVNYLSKQGERLLLQKAPREVRENMVNRCAQMLATYRQHCSPGSSLGQLVLPETMKLLPLLVNCIIKHSAFTGGADLSIDDRAWLMQILPSMSPLDTVYYFYPRILPVHDLTDETDELPTPVRCSYENLAGNGAYLFENGIVVLFWIGLGVSQEWIQDVFGVQNFAQINAERHDLPEKDNATSRNLRKMLAKVQQEKGRCMKLYIIKQQDKLEPWFRKFMVEDKGADSSPSYVDFLCHVHKEIRNLLS